MHNGPSGIFTFADIFAGIGGIRYGFESVGGRCVFSAEYDPHSQTTYQTFFGERPDFSSIDPVVPPGDITKLSPDKVPEHDILTGGFPCQPFSLAGVSKKQSLGRPHGLDDPKQGRLFFSLLEILVAKRPKAFFFENVKNLLGHDKGRTFAVLQDALSRAGYHIHAKVVDASFWVPQKRQRLYIVGFQDPAIAGCFDFNNIKPTAPRVSLAEILETEVSEKYMLGKGTWDTLVRHKAHHEAKGQGFGYGLLTPPWDNQTTRTLSARYHKDGAEILIHQEGMIRPRRLTPLECCRLMGFPKKCERWFDRSDTAHPQPVCDTHAYRQFGNSVVVPVITAIAGEMIRVLKISPPLPGR